MARKKPKIYNGQHYAWKPGASAALSIDPDEAGARLNTIRQRDGVLTAEAVVTDAEDPSSPLHSAFEWDDAKAAKAHRLAQAGHLIRSLVIHRAPEEPPVRAYLNIRRAAAPGYHDTETVLSVEAMRDEALASAFRRLREVEAVYSHLDELAGVWTALAEAQGIIATRADVPEPA